MKQKQKDALHKKRSAQKDASHKKNWREEYASVEEIQIFLMGRLMLRHNVITGRTEYRLPSSYEHDGTDWGPISDRVVNSLWADLSATKPVRIQDIYHVLESDFVPEFHPFRFYLEQLPAWDGKNHILMLSTSVVVKGDGDGQVRFYEYLRKWLVGMVAGWLDDEVVNHVILTLIGRQGIYKTTWFNYLLPPELRRYFYTKTNAGRLSKDDMLTLSQYGLVCCEELDTMSPRELNQLKSAVTMPSVDERAAYAHFHEHRAHIASFCGTGNNTQFLSDNTGNRRWLPFEVEYIESPRDYPFDYVGIFSEAYALYKNNFHYWFSREEMRQLMEYNRQFETAQDELELVDYYFRQPSGADAGEFMPTAVARQIVSTPGANVSTVALGRAFKKLGFRSGVENKCRGYYVVRRKEEERRMRARSLAYDSSQNETQMTDKTDVF